MWHLMQLLVVEYNSGLWYSTQPYILSYNLAQGKTKKYLEVWINNRKQGGRHE